MSAEESEFREVEFFIMGCKTFALKGDIIILISK